jgi:hypothetical protein
MLPADLIAFMHIYKCGGTTFNWILQRTFPGAVLYCENSPPVIRHIEPEQYEGFKAVSRTSYSALSSHLIRYEALKDFSHVVTTLRDPAKRLISAFNYDVARGDCTVDLDTYIEQRVNTMTWTLGKDFINDIDSGRIFCCILEEYDLSLVCLEYWLDLNGIQADLSAPKALNSGAEKINDAKAISSLSSEQVKRIQKLNQEDYDLYRTQKSKLKGIAMVLPDLQEKLSNYTSRKKAAAAAIDIILSYGQGPRHFTFL